MHFESTNSTSLNDDARISDVRSIFTTVYEIVAGVSLVVLIAFAIFSKDKPPTPPSEAEALLEKTAAVKDEKVNWKFDIHHSISLFCNWPFVMLTLGNFLCTSATVIQLVLMPSLVATTFPENGISRVISYVNLAAFIGAGVFAFATARLVDRIKSYKTISWAGERDFRN